MKKIYSLVLMAVILLVGTNAWADPITLGLDGSGADCTTLQAAFDAVPDGGTATILLISDNYVTNAQAWLGTKELAGTPKNITLDLNGKSYTYTGTANVAIALTHGKLTVKNGSIETASAKEDLIRVYGTYQEIDGKTETPFSYFVLEEGATLKTTKKNALVVDQLTNAQKATWLCTTNNFDYCTSIFASKATKMNDRGLANGVKLEIKGNIEAKKYGIKVNGNVGYINDYLEDKDNLTFKSYLPQYIAGRLPGSYAITNKSLGGACAPYVLIGPNAKIKSDATATEAVAVYAAGFGRWEIQGSCEGSTGLYAKSGEILLHDASVKSTNNNDVTVVPGKTSGVTAGGSAIVVESNVAYSGNTSVTISGDSHIEGTSGYAIEETKASGTPSDVEGITIEGGTIVGGDAGAIIVTEETAGDDKVAVVGGDFAGLIQTVDDSGNKTVGDVDDYIPSNAEVHTTEVTVNGKTTIVVSQGEDAPAVANSVIGATNYTAVQWKNTSVTEETLNDSLILTELVIAEDYDQKLTIAAGKVLIVGRVVLGARAQIIVKPGAKFIVTSIDGVSAHEASNIKLESSETAQAEFIFHPGVTSNRQPMATVDMTVAQGKDAIGENVWTRFAIPVKSLSAPWTKKNGYGTWLYEWDYYANGGQGDWALVSGGSTGMKPWAGYTLSYNEKTEEVYTFTGNLLGNVNAALSFVHKGYNFFGNSYSGYIDAKTLLAGLADAHIDGSLYMWNADEQTYGAVTLNRLNTSATLEAWEKDIAPMQTFILQLRDADNASESVNYASAIYSNPRHGNVKGAAPGAASAAPRRVLANHVENASIYMVVTAANGKSDRIILTEGADFTDAFESGFDASKFMNENSINVYATIDGENYSDVATYTLEGKTISLQTRNEATYTLSFKSVEGAEYAIRDNVTGSVIAIEEGAAYEFAAQPNSVVEGRFEIVKVSKVATDIENTEVKANVKGIYSITGMYMGENFDVLPAGVYVVNGVKIVK